MADQELKVVLRFDSKEVATGAPEAAAQIDAVGEAAERTGKTGTAAFTGLTQASQSFAGSTSDDIKKILDRYDPVGARLQQLKADFAALNQSAMSGGISPKDDARTDTAYAKIAAEIKGIEDAANGVTPAVNKAGEEMKNAADKGAFATAGARRELIVLGHEAITGNFSRMPGSFMVLAERASISGAAILGVVAPIAALAAVGYVLAKAFSEGHAEMESMNNSLAITSGYAGVTRGQILGLASDVSAASTMAMTQSKSLVTSLVASGKIGADALAPIAQLADNFAAAMGKDVAEIGPQLLKLFEDPAKGAMTLNGQMHFLTLAEQEQIETLVRLGKTTEAQLLLSEKLSEHLPKHVDQLGDLQRAWLSVKQAASNAWDSMLGAGRAQTTQQMLAEVTQDIERGNTDGYGGSDGALASQARLQAQLRAEIAAAQQQGKDADKNARQSRLAEEAKSLSKPYQISALRDKVQAFDTAASEADASGDSASAKLYREAIVAENEKIKSLLSQAGKEQYQISITAEQQRQKDLADIQKWAADDQKKQFEEGLISKEDELRSLSALDNQRLSQLERSYLAEAALAKKHGDKAASVKYLAEAARAATDRAALPQLLSNQIGAEANKQSKEAGAITTKLSDSYGKEDRTRQEAEATALMSESQKRLADALVKVNEKAIAARESLDLKFPEQERNSEAYKRALGDIDAAQQAAAISTKAWNDRQDELNASWSNGADKALTKYLDSVKNVSAQSEKLMTGAFQGMEDALTNFVKTGKLDFSSLANSIITDLIRMQIQASITGPLAASLSAAGGLSGLMSGMFATTGAQGYQLPGSSPSAPVYGSDLVNANGNVFLSPSLHSFVNQVRDTPTHFDMGSGPRAFANGGIFSEAGEEAVMPLTRDAAGRLGVRAQGGGKSGGLVVNIVESPGNGGQVQQTPGSNGGPDILTILVEKTKAAVTSDVAKGGALAVVMERRYGLSPAMGALR